MFIHMYVYNYNKSLLTFDIFKCDGGALKTRMDNNISVFVSAKKLYTN